MTNEQADLHIARIIKTASRYAAMMGGTYIPNPKKIEIMKRAILRRGKIQ